MQLNFHIADNAEFPAVKLIDEEGNTLAEFPLELEDLVVDIVDRYNSFEQ